MSNVIPFSSRKSSHAPAPSAEDERVALAADLIDLLDQVRDATARMAAFPGPSLHVERTAQHLLDAATSLEQAVDALTENGQWVPF
jgi:hypothetical protein